jgi:DNA-binding CsgD family transcriptional regulator
LILKKSISNLEIIADSIRKAMEVAESKSPAAWVDSHGSPHENAFASVLSSMTDTQIETLRLVATGLSNAEIGRVRFVSEKSVEQIVARIAGHFAITPDRTRNLRVAWISFFDARLAEFDGQTLHLDFSDSRKLGSAHEYSEIRDRQIATLKSVIKQVLGIDIEITLL